MPKLGEKTSLKTRIKMSIAHKGKPTWNKGGKLTEEWKRKIGIANSISRKGIKFSKEHKEKISLALKGKIVSEETKKKISLAMKGIKRIGHKHSEETKQRMSKIFKGRPAWNKGKKCPEISKRLMGKNHPRWKGITKDSKGYLLIHKNEHPFCNRNKYIRRSRLVMEKYLGRYLKPEEVVHHINKNIIDDRIDNLILFPNQSEHRKYHLTHI